MADAFSVNEFVPTTNALYAVWRLTRVLISAGWTVVRSSDGTTFGAADYWTTYAGLGTSAWIVLQGPGGRQICLWRGTTSVDNGKIIYVKSGGFAFAGTYGAADPGTIPTLGVYCRGSSGTFNSWLCGGVNAIRWLHVCAKDVSDGSFWIMGTTPSPGAPLAYHTLGFFSLYSCDANDTDPYAVYTNANAPTTNSSGTYGGYNDYILNEQGENAEASGYWWAWSRNTYWRSFRPTIQSSFMAGTLVRDPYATGGPLILDSVGIGKTEASYSEFKGYVKHMRVVSLNDARGTVYSDNTVPYKWVAVGSNYINNNAGALWFWDGASPGMALEF